MSYQDLVLIPVFETLLAKRRWYKDKIEKTAVDLPDEADWERGVMFFKRHGCDTDRAVELTALALGLKEDKYPSILKCYDGQKYRGLERLDIELESDPELWSEFVDGSDGELLRDATGQPLHVDLFDQDSVPTSDPGYFEVKESTREYLERLGLEYLAPYANEAEVSGCVLICPPVGPYSPVNEIEEWIKELQKMEPSPDLDEAIKEAKQWISWQMDQ